MSQTQTKQHVVTRSRHNLQPLTTDRTYRSRLVTSSPRRRNSPLESAATPTSATSLASPTLLAVRQYYRDHGLTTAFQASPVKPRSSPSLELNHPRRHSAVALGLVPRFSKVTVSSPLARSTQSTVKRESRSLAEESRQLLLTGLSEGELVRLGSVVARRKSASPPDVLVASSRVPFEYAHTHLRQWGHVYLGNVATADVYVRAAHSRATESKEPNTAAGSDADRKKAASVTPNTATSKITIRAMVTPRATERKPFLLQRQFDLDELRSSMPQVANTKIGLSPIVEISSDPTENLGPAFRTRAKSNATATVVESIRSVKFATGVKSAWKGEAGIDRRTMPIHVEYALHYLPVLAALLLSGHVRKGDTIDLPLPHPEAWRDTVAYVYTGQGKVTAATRENIVYLAGQVG